MRDVPQPVGQGTLEDRVRVGRIAPGRTGVKVRCEGGDGSEQSSSDPTGGGWRGRRDGGARQGPLLPAAAAPPSDVLVGSEQAATAADVDDGLPEVTHLVVSP
jgi:hypothetical protein